MKLINYIKNPKLFLSVIRKQKLINIPDKLYVKIIYLERTGKHLKLNSPVTFSEKLNWLKLYDHKNEYKIMVDKYRVKDYVANIIGKEYIIPLLGVYDSADEIDFDSLPQKCVLKCNHDSNSIVILDKEQNNDYNIIKEKLNKSLSIDFYKLRREWPYKNMERKIICEEYLGEDLFDYKFYCFNGNVEFLHISRGNISNGSFEVSWYDLDLNKLEYYRGHYPGISLKINKHKEFDKMVEIARILSQNIPFLRVDFFVLEKKVYFAELTFYPGGGITPFNSEEFEKYLGDMINIDIIK